MACLGNDDRRSIEPACNGFEAGRAHQSIPVRIDLDDACPPEAEVAQGDMVGDVRVGADNDVDRRCAGKPVFVDVVAGAPEHLAPRRCKTYERGHGRTGD